MSDRWETILAIFDAVRHAPEAQRPALLADRCGSDSGLRAEVESLLENDSRADADFLRPKEIGEWRVGEIDSLIGASVAGYTIKECIARGGMGTVYLAGQKSPRRDVALKVLLAGFWTRSAAKRFEAESHILGYLRHPNIAQVYEAGTHRLETGATIHYFAMEYVPDARPITKYADEHSLTQQSRLELFLQLCDAVTYGHQKGVIHRDLKPANILVGSEGPSGGAFGTRPLEPSVPRPLLKVIDFGIARTVDSDIAATTMHTEAGQLLGTLAYMSPEQCAADPSQIDTTTDIYSLGVILYELLTGRMPYDVSNMTIQSAARVICEQEPRRPSTFARSGTGLQPVKGDLETIILKAIEKPRAKRYQSVSDLANDLRRWINGEPISARPPTVYSKMLRWAARHPLATPILAGLVMASAIVFSTKRAVDAIRQRPDTVVLTRFGQTEDFWSHRPVRQGDRALFLSYSKEILGQWTSKNNSAGIVGVATLDRDESFGGGVVAQVGFSVDYGDELAGKLCLFEPHEDDVPVRQMFVDEATVRGMPDHWWPRPDFDKKRQYHAKDFGLTDAWVFDVFNDSGHPGAEIVAFFQHRLFTQGVLRIYNQNGELLFAVWQDGGIKEVSWLAAERLLVCIAPKGDRDEPAFTKLNESRHPKVIFAIRPEAGCISNEWIFPTAPTSWKGKVYPAIWYKTFCPSEFAKSWLYYPLISTNSSLSTGYSSDRHLMLYFCPAKESGRDQAMGFNVVIDAKGKVVHRQSLSDGGRQLWEGRTDLPNPRHIDLVDWTTEDFPCTQPAAPQ